VVPAPFHCSLGPICPISLTVVTIHFMLFARMNWSAIIGAVVFWAVCSAALAAPSTSSSSCIFNTGGATFDLSELGLALLECVFVHFMSSSIRPRACALILFLVFMCIMNAI
jgi:hypothetical protein